MIYIFCLIFGTQPTLSTDSSLFTSKQAKADLDYLTLSHAMPSRSRSRFVLYPGLPRRICENPALRAALQLENLRPAPLDALFFFFAKPSSVPNIGGLTLSDCTGVMASKAAMTSMGNILRLIAKLQIRA
jgi:hypothetical protein